jgi:hypothetical protein
MTSPASTPPPPADKQRPLLLVLGTGSRNYREYLLASISTRYRIHLLLGAEPTWEQDYLTGWTVLTQMGETIDATEMIAAAGALAADRRVSGVLTWDEARVLQAAKVAAALGLPGGDPEMALRCRDKHLTREALAEAGLAQPRSVLVSTLEAALDVAAGIGYPVVLKPRAMAASLGTVLVGGPADLIARFPFARDTTVPGAWRYDAGVLVEEYVDGPEVSIDSAVHRGRVWPMFVARKEIGYPPYFEETGHLVNAADPLLTDPDVLRYLQDTHTALGFTDGITHTEVKLTPAGPKLIEVNARLGGDMIPYLGLRATGIDPGLAAAAVACGQHPQTQPDRSLVGGVRFFYVDSDDTSIGSVYFDETGLPETLDLLVPLVKTGDVVSPPPKGTVWGRIAYATALAATEQDCRDALEAAQAALRVTTGEHAAG